MDNQINKNEKVDNFSEKELLYTMLTPIVLAAIVMFLFVYLQNSSSNDNKELVNAFNDNKELICFSKVVSKSNGYKFDEKKENYVSNGVDIFYINRCGLK